MPPVAQNTLLDVYKRQVEMAVVMSNLLSLKVNDFKATKTEFTDVPAWAAPYVAACKADGIIAGYSATTFGSKDVYKRQQWGCAAGLGLQKACPAWRPGWQDS